jgi:transcription elongation factor Elf1
VGRNDDDDDDIRSVRHSPEFDTESINRAVESASKNDQFIQKAMNLTKDLSFPALKRDIVNHVKGNSSSVDSEFIALFESIDGYIEYKDTYHLRKALEQNNSEKKKTNQITGPARANPTEPSRISSGGYVATKSESGSHKEVRTDYAEVPPSAMSNFICRNCGKQFQNQNDLIQHQQFEGIENTDKST